MLAQPGGQRAHHYNGEKGRLLYNKQELVLVNRDQPAILLLKGRIHRDSGSSRCRPSLQDPLWVPIFCTELLAHAARSKISGITVALSLIGQFELPTRCETVHWLLSIEIRERPRTFLASGPWGRLCGTLFHLMCSNRKSCDAGAPWNGNLLPRLLKLLPVVGITGDVAIDGAEADLGPVLSLP